MTLHHTPGRRLLALAGWVLLCFGAAALGGWFMPGEWYASLKKPAWNPPGWIFGPVWTALYLMMATSAWLVWRRVGWNQAHIAYFIQLLLNASWTPLFFGAHAIGWALVVIIALWLAIAFTRTAFGRIDLVASRLLLPYLGWVTFATLLNASMWWLNH